MIVYCQKVRGKMPVSTGRTISNRLKYWLFGKLLSDKPVWRYK